MSAVQGIATQVGPRRLFGPVRAEPLTVLAAVAVIYAVGMRLAVTGGSPLWLDEAWTLAIVGQPDWASSARQILWDVNAPLYYVLMHLWQAVFGLSDHALRAPSLLAWLATPPAAFLLGRRSGVARGTAAAWAALLALWAPGMLMAQEARCYALLLLLCVFQTLLFARLLEQPTLRRASAWSAVSLLACLTHYDAGLLLIPQACVLLARRPRQTLALWPAALIFLPGAAWLAIHAPRVMEMTRADITWYAPLRLSDLPDVVVFVLDSDAGLLAVFGGVATAALLTLAASKSGEGSGSAKSEPAAQASAVAWACAASLIGAALVVALGVLRPSFTYRYLTPFVPGLLLGAPLCLARLNRAWAPLLTGLVIGAFAFAVQPSVIAQAQEGRGVFSYEAASAYLAAAGPRRVVFTWDNPTSPVLKSGQIQAAGGAFFRRAGTPVEIVPVVFQKGVDPNTAMLRVAAPAGSAILWVYDTAVHDTFAAKTPPRIAQADPRWECRDFGRANIGVLACRERVRSLAGRPRPLTEHTRVAGQAVALRGRR